MTSVNFKKMMKTTRVGVLVKVRVGVYAKSESKMDDEFGCQSLNAIVLYHLSSGQICHAQGQDPLHLDDDVTQYMQKGLL